MYWHSGDKDWALECDISEEEIIWGTECSGTAKGGMYWYNGSVLGEISADCGGIYCDMSTGWLWGGNNDSRSSIDDNGVENDDTEVSDDEAVTNEGSIDSSCKGGTIFGCDNMREWLSDNPTITTSSLLLSLYCCCWVLYSDDRGHDGLEFSDLTEGEREGLLIECVSYIEWGRGHNEEDGV